MAFGEQQGIQGVVGDGRGTGVGSIVPAFPYAFLHGGAAFALSTVLCMALTVAVGLLRTTPPQRARRVAVTIGVLAVVYGVTLACALATRGGAA